MFYFWWSAGLLNGLKSCPPPLSSQKNKMLIFGLLSTSDDQLGWSIDSNPIHHLPSAKKMKCSFLYYIQHLIIGRADQWTWMPSSPPLSSLNNEMPIFVLCWTSNDQPGWSMASNPIHHLSLAKIMKCSFLDYIQLLIISWAGYWTWNPSTTTLQPNKWNAHFWIMFNFWWSARLVNGLKSCIPPLSSQKMKCSFLD